MSSKADRSEKRFTKAEKSWIMYDWANSIYATNIMAAIFPIYFAMQADETGNKLYGFAVSAAALVVAVLAPILGAIGDFSGMKKKLFAGFLVLGLVFTAVMAAFEDWRLMLVGFILSRIGFSGSCLFYDSFLTDVTTPERMDRVSSWGYAMGYIGGSTIPFIISIAVMLLMNQSVLSYKIAILIVVVWWAVFSIPFLKNVKQQYSVEDAPQALAKEAFRNAWKTFKDILKDKKILFFIIAYFFYIDGVDTIISMATNYGETLGLGAIGMILALLVTQIVAVPFSILFGNLAKKVGAMRMIAIAVCVYFVITILGFFMGFNIEQAELSGGDIDAALKLSSTLFWILATLVGTVQGGIQALSRSYFGQLIPPERSNEYYGFLDIFGKFSCVIGPALYAATYAATGRASLGILSIIVLFFGGMVALFAGRKYMKAEEK
ncbi:MAG: MFS transporter [Eubacteriales bacterium]|nr:MFS transporter [Eubacteriales bacterium]MCI6670148.1 MFS transporter [Christensenellaceae bacterium]MCI6942964.1 MFS transporter [Christensenellaceae bacterium]MDY3975056.1 MFS transporter [Eubacteriales bacterium]MDY4695154.1 MFS transporter [Eubacteriales bacterium]